MGQFWVVTSVVKKGSFVQLLVRGKRGSFEWLLGWLKQDSFGW